MDKKIASILRTLVLACGLALSAGSVLVMVVSSELAVRMTAALGFGAGIIIILLSVLIAKFEILRGVLRHIQYLSQSSEYMARLLREITEVMKAIEEVELEEREERRKKGNNPGIKVSGEYREPLTAEEQELESAVRQFEV